MSICMCLGKMIFTSF